MTVGMKFLSVLKSLIVAYVMTALILLLVAFGVYKLELTEAIVNILVIVIYVLVTFLGGLLTGKAVKEKQFLWGAIFGFLYILLIFGASIIVSEGFDLFATRTITSLLLCVAGGLLGGMLS